MGKTFLAKAVAGELGAGFLECGHFRSQRDMWYGNSEKLMHEAFLKRLGFKSPACCFSMRSTPWHVKRSSFVGQVGRSLVNQLLAEMDGVNSKNDGVYILAATNHPWDLDRAADAAAWADWTEFFSFRLPTPRRESRSLAVRWQKFRTSRSISSGSATIRTVSLGADMAHLSKSAAEFALAESMKSGARLPGGPAPH